MAKQDAKAKPNSFWPKVDSADGARAARNLGLFAAGWSIGGTLLLLFLFGSEEPARGYEDIVGPWMLVDVAVVAALGFGVYRYSRVAAVLALIVYVVGSVNMAIALPGSVHGGKIVMWGLFTLLHINAIRGCFAFHRLRQTAPPTPA